MSAIRRGATHIARKSLRSDDYSIRCGIGREDVEAWLAKEKLSPEEGVAMLEERYKKYKYVEASMTSQKTRMAEKLPDFKHSLAILDVLIDKKEKEQPFETTYLVSEEVYTKATVRKPEKVSIWLGANVMVEYELDKAKELLEKNRGNVQKAVDELTSELAFVKDQITTTEVNIAHVHNYGVKKRQQKAAA
ncbi:prefoldin subunit [Ancylostoma caninum]|uniref:Prefoldin subunit 3 n=1 Tax=Ancylostoma caninum TaxID=29170 RepID=A0A368GM72_ANCCA|nr:prefoldin subunit [Ancylostoma caninum]